MTNKKKTKFIDLVSGQCSLNVRESQEQRENIWFVYLRYNKSIHKSFIVNSYQKNK